MTNDSGWNVRVHEKKKKLYGNSLVSVNVKISIIHFRVVRGLPKTLHNA